MQRFFARTLDGVTLADAIQNKGGVSIFSRSAAPADSRSDATTHGGFDDDGPTMTSVVMRALGVTAAAPEYDYQPNAALKDSDGAPGFHEVTPSALAGQAGSVSPAEPAALRAAAPMPFAPAAETHAPGETPIVETSAAQPEQPTPPPQPNRMVVEVAVAPRTGSPILDVLQASGYALAEDVGESRSPEGPKTAGRRTSTKTKRGKARAASSGETAGTDGAGK
jgi:hypothetical protein